jgi:hypothetical protein
MLRFTRRVGTMSLLGWLGAPAIHPRSLSPIMKRAIQTDRVVLGVLGTRSQIRLEDLETQWFGPLVEAWGIPDEILLPAEGDSSQAIQSWAQVKEVPVRLLSCDWGQLGKKAALFRDNRIQREATHLLLIQGPRSTALSSLAQRLARKGRPVIISERPGEQVKPGADATGKKVSPK